jgi:exodeoxyribonuclease VIII
MKKYPMSYSALKAFAKSPNHYIQYIEGTHETTPAMLLGQAIHCLILEPHKFNDSFAISPQVDRRTNDGKASWALFLDSAQDKNILTPAEFDKAALIADITKENYFANQLLDRCKEFEVYKEAGIYGMQFKGIADAVASTYIVDIKTCSDASPDGFMRQAHNLHYHLQAAIYRHIFGVNLFYWIAVETTAPHNVQVYRQSDRAFEQANKFLANLVSSFRGWDGSPTGYGDYIMDLDLPKWA